MTAPDTLSDRKRSARTFTETARRAQIVQAAIETIAELGYARASYAQIAATDRSVEIGMGHGISKSRSGVESGSASRYPGTFSSEPG